MNPEPDETLESVNPEQTMDASPLARPRSSQAMADLHAGICLEVLGGPMDGISSSTTGDTLTIGRDQSCDVSLPLDLLVSTRHARLVREGRLFWLEDLGSRNGSFVDDQRVVGRSQVSLGSLIVVGNTCLEFVTA